MKNLFLHISVIIVVVHNTFSGVQTKTFSDLQTLINTLSSSLSSLSAKLDTKLQDMGETSHSYYYI